MSERATVVVCYALVALAVALMFGVAQDRKAASVARFVEWMHG